MIKLKDIMENINGELNEGIKEDVLQLSNDFEKLGIFKKARYSSRGGSSISKYGISAYLKPEVEYKDVFKTMEDNYKKVGYSYYDSKNKVYFKIVPMSSGEWFFNVRRNKFKR